MPLWLELIVAGLLVIGAAFTLIGSFALAKLDDFLRRLHGPTKATTLGLGCLLVASAIAMNARGHLSLHELLVTAFLFLTSPVSAHLLVMAALATQPAIRPPPPEFESERR